MKIHLFQNIFIRFSHHLLLQIYSKHVFHLFTYVFIRYIPKRKNTGKFIIQLPCRYQLKHLYITVWPHMMNPRFHEIKLHDSFGAFVYFHVRFKFKCSLHKGSTCNQTTTLKLRNLGISSFTLTQILVRKMTILQAGINLF